MQSHHLPGANYPCLLKLHFVKRVIYGSSVWLNHLFKSLKHLQLHVLITDHICFSKCHYFQAVQHHDMMTGEWHIRRNVKVTGTHVLSFYLVEGLRKTHKIHSICVAHCSATIWNWNLPNKGYTHYRLNLLASCNSVTLNLIVHTALPSGKFIRLKYVISSVLTYLWLYHGVLRSATYTWEPHVFPLMSSSSVVVVKATIFWLETEQRVWPSCKLKRKHWHMCRYTKMLALYDTDIFQLQQGRKPFWGILFSDREGESLPSFMNRTTYHFKFLTPLLTTEKWPLSNKLAMS